MDRRSAVTYERRFAALATVASLFVLLLGFGRSFFFRPFFSGPPDYAALEPVFYVHGTVFASWFVLLAVQTLLIRSRNLKLHRRLGFAGIALAVLITGFGAYVALVAATRPGGFKDVPVPSEQFLIIPLSDVAFFAAYAGLGFHFRKNPAIHKRWIFLASAALLEAAAVRIPLMLGVELPNFEIFTLGGLVGMLAIWDFVLLRRVHPVTLWGGVGMVVTMSLRLTIAESSMWQSFGRWAMGLMA